MLLVACPKCRSNLQIPDDLLGKVVACSACKTRIQTPAPQPIATAPVVPVAAPVTPTRQPVSTPPRLELHDGPPASSEPEAIALTEADLVEDAPPRTEMRPVRRPTPSASNDPFAFDQPGGASGSSGDTDRRPLPNRRALAPAKRAANWMALAAVLDFVYSLIMFCFGLAFGVGVAFPGLLLCLLLLWGSDSMAAQRSKGTIYAAACVAFLIALGFLLGAAFFVLILVRMLAGSLRGGTTFGLVICGVFGTVLLALSAVNFLAGLRPLLALNDEAVQEAFQVRADRAAERAEEEERRRDREWEEDERRYRRRGSD